MNDRVAREQANDRTAAPIARPARRPADSRTPAPAGVPPVDGGPRVSDAVLARAASSTRIRRSSANVIQRRVPLWSEIEADMNGPDRMELEQGLAAAVKRTKKDLTPEQKATAKKRMWMLKNHPKYRD